MFEWIICILAGIGAGLGTGFAGMSAAAVISPMLIVFLDVDPYQAIGISLASDVLASGVSAINYGKHKNIDIRNGIAMMLSVIIFTFISSYLSQFVSGSAMGGFSIFMMLALGLRFLIKPVKHTTENINKKNSKKRLIQSIFCGVLIGCICGFVGAGGGIMMLFILTSVLGYELKTAVGTSVFIMTFTALTGALSHFYIGELPNIKYLMICAATTFIFAQIASKIANKASPKLLNRITGIILTLLSCIIIIMQYIIK